MRQNYLNMKFISIFIIMDKKLYNSVSKLVNIGDALIKKLKKAVTQILILPKAINLKIFQININ